MSTKRAAVPLARYANGGLEALVAQSTRPDTCPHQMDPVIEPSP